MIKELKYFKAIGIIHSVRIIYYISSNYHLLSPYFSRYTLSDDGSLPLITPQCVISLTNLKMITEDDLTNLNEESLRRFVSRLLRSESIRNAIHNVLDDDELSIIKTVPAAKSSKQAAQKHVMPDKNCFTPVKNMISVKNNFLKSDDMSLLAGELEDIPYENARNKPSTFMLSKMNESYGRHTPCSFDAYPVLNRILGEVNDKQNQQHIGCLIHRYDNTCQPTWQRQEGDMLKHQSPITLLTVGAKRTMEFSSKSQKHGRSSSYHVEMLNNTIVSLPSGVREHYLTRVSKAASVERVKFTYKLCFLTTQSSAIISPVMETSNDIEMLTDNSCDFSNRDPAREAELLKDAQVPFIKYHNTPFKNLTYDDINQCTEYTHKFQNRSAVYYGDQTYSYSGVTHNPKPINDNVVLAKIVGMVNDIYPHGYKSAMIHQYKDGTYSMPHHSDDEPEIEQDSLIVTLSFGQKRVMNYKSKSRDYDYDGCEVSLDNGDILLMSRKSQDIYTHAIVEDLDCKNPRLSITLRILVELNPKSNEGDQWLHPRRRTGNFNIPSSNRNNIFQQQSNSNLRDNAHGKKSLIIGDSMLSRLQFGDNVVNKCIGGAKTLQYLKFIQSNDFKTSVQQHKFEHIFVCLGTNDIGSGNSIHNILSNYKNILIELRSLFPNTQINVLNIFPRQLINSTMAEKILRTNNGLYHLCRLTPKVNFIKYFYSFLNEGFVNKNLFYHRDLLHFSDIGSEMIKRCISRYF